MNKEVRPGVMWLVLWIAAAATAAIGVLLLYLGPDLFPVGKGSVPTPFLGQVPVALIAIGMAGGAVGAVGIARSRWPTASTTNDQQSTVQGNLGVGTTRGSDAAALAGFSVAGAALLALVLIELVWPIVAASMLAGPCDQNPTLECFGAHPDYYQEMAPGDYSTPVSRIGDNVLSPIMLSALPLGLAGALVSVIALATGTRRRRAAVLGVVLGTLTVAGMGAMYLAFLIGGGD